MNTGPNTDPITYAASAGTVIAGFTISDWAAIGGLVIALVSYLTGLYFKHQQLKILRESNVTSQGDSSQGR